MDLGLIRVACTAYNKASVTNSLSTAAWLIPVVESMKEFYSNMPEYQRDIQKVFDNPAFSNQPDVVQTAVHAGKAVTYSTYINGILAINKRHSLNSRQVLELCSCVPLANSPGRFKKVCEELAKQMDLLADGKILAYKYIDYCQPKYGTVCGGPCQRTVPTFTTGVEENIFIALLQALNDIVRQYNAAVIAPKNAAKVYNGMIKELCRKVHGAG